MIEIEIEGSIYTINVFYERMQLRIYEARWGGKGPWDSYIKEWRNEIAARLWKVRAIMRKLKNFAQ